MEGKRSARPVVEAPAPRPLSGGVNGERCVNGQPRASGEKSDGSGKGPTEPPGKATNLATHVMSAAHRICSRSVRTFQG